MNSCVFILNTLSWDHCHHPHPPSCPRPHPLPRPTCCHHLSCPCPQCPPPPPPPLSPCPECQSLHAHQANPRPQKPHPSQNKSSSLRPSTPWCPSDSAWRQPSHNRPQDVPQQACSPAPTQRFPDD